MDDGRCPNTNLNVGCEIDTTDDPTDDSTEDPTDDPTDDPTTSDPEPITTAPDKQCPEGWWRAGDACYSSSHSRMTWFSAQEVNLLGRLIHDMTLKT